MALEYLQNNHILYGKNLTSYGFDIYDKTAKIGSYVSYDKENPKINWNSHNDELEYNKDEAEIHELHNQGKVFNI